MPVELVGEVSFSVHQATRNSERSRRPITGRIQAHGSHISVTFSRSPSLLGSPRSSARRWLDVLDRAGLTVQVMGPNGSLVTAGHEVHSPWWQRLVTGSRRIRLGSGRAVLGTLSGPRLFDVVVPEWLAAPAVPPAGRLTSTLTTVLTRRKPQE